MDGFLWALLVVCFRWVALCLGWRGRQRWRKRREEGEAREQGKGKGGGRKEKEARREEGGCNEMGLEGDRHGARIWFSQKEQISVCIAACQPPILNFVPTVKKVVFKQKLNSVVLDDHI